MAAGDRSRTRCLTTSGLQRLFKWHLHFVVHKEGFGVLGCVPDGQVVTGQAQNTQHSGTLH